MKEKIPIVKRLIKNNKLLQIIMISLKMSSVLEQKLKHRKFIILSIISFVVVKSTIDSVNSNKKEPN